MKPAPQMQCLIRTHNLKPPSEELITYFMREFQVDRAECLRRLEIERNSREYWINDLYQVEVTRNEQYTQLNIRRRDGRVILRDWRHFQQIKNEICGEECEGVELYPAESRLTDTSNKYHIWVINDPTFRFPFGFPDRDVSDMGGKTPGMRQRSFHR